MNFKGNKINFTFDEFVQIDNFEQNAIVSPVPKRTPNVVNRLNTITVTIKDTLEPNTTYTIDFGNSIKDFDEGNVMKKFTYIFSTGPALDSLSFRGNVIVAETGMVDTMLTVMLHKRGEDSAVRNERPRYISKIDAKGNFVFRNLPPGVFYIYALEDNSRSYRYIDPTKLFAFADSPVVVKTGTPHVTLYAYHGEKPRESSSGSTSGRPSAADKRLKFQTNAKGGGSFDILQKFSLQFERPLRTFDSTKVILSTDTTYTPVTDYTWTRDSTNKKLTLNYSFIENSLYHIVFQKDFASDTLKQQLLRPDTITFRTMRKEDYGKLSIRFRNLNLSTHPVLEFVQNDVVVSTFPLTGEVFSQPLFIPGEYELRILYDRNQNGVWDPGKFFGKHQQPELVKPITTRKYTVKPSWDNDFEINL